VYLPEQSLFPRFAPGGTSCGSITMRCPKCQFDHPLQRTECLKCGIVFSHYQPPPEPPAPQLDAPAPQADPLAKKPAPAMPPAVPSAQVAMAAAALSRALSADADQPSTPAERRKDTLKEIKYRVLALPLALLLARWLTGTGFDVAAGMLAMVVHESGHAITAWLTGRWAIPMLWVTMHGDDRSWFVVFLVTAAIGFGGFLAWRAQKWGWVCAAAVMLMVQLYFLSSPWPPGAMIVFGGDGGALVLATILMLAFYAPRDSALYKSWGVRWGLLVIGALAFMHVYRSWSGPYENIPFGEIEGVNLSDPSLLTVMYGWSVIQLVDRYLRLATLCFVAMGVIYVWGLAAAYLELRLPETEGKISVILGLKPGRASTT
jgi:hypothetical protein